MLEVYALVLEGSSSQIFSRSWYWLPLWITITEASDQHMMWTILWAIWKHPCVVGLRCWKNRECEMKLIYACKTKNIPLLGFMMLGRMITHVSLFLYLNYPSYLFSPFMQYFFIFLAQSSYIRVTSITWTLSKQKQEINIFTTSIWPYHYESLFNGKCQSNCWGIYMK